ncbi:MAG: hypothetical protein L0L39_05075 [Atopostipes suicloacalis]|nr:hypothetical protein [Atopostipes suicloacalis]
MQTDRASYAEFRASDCEEMSDLLLRTAGFIEMQYSVLSLKLKEHSSMTKKTTKVTSKKTQTP